MIKEAILRLSKRDNLTYHESFEVMDEIMSGKASDVQISSYLTALSLKGETIDEITGSAAGMRNHCVKLLHDQNVLEIVGTGGDHSNSFNISTTAAIIVSAAGVPIAKHGNRSASSKCGSADVLEALGVNINIPAEASARLLEEIGICFMFAQNYHIAMKYVAPIRRELGIRTVFNIIGPLSNPAGAKMELLGVYEEALVEPIAKVLAQLGVQNAMVVYGKDGLDEISLSAPTAVCEVKNGWVKSYEITPEQFGFKKCDKNELLGGAARENAEIILEILRGKKGAKRNAAVLNAAAALYVVKEISFLDAIKEVEEVIDSGKAMEQLEKFIKFSNGVK